MSDQSNDGMHGLPGEESEALELDGEVVTYPEDEEGEEDVSSLSLTVRREVLIPVETNRPPYDQPEAVLVFTVEDEEDEVDFDEFRVQVSGDRLDQLIAQLQELSAALVRYRDAVAVGEEDDIRVRLLPREQRAGRQGGAEDVLGPFEGGMYHCASLESLGDLVED